MKVEEKSFPTRHFAANLNEFQQRYCRLKTADSGDFTVVMAALFFTALNDFWQGKEIILKLEYVLCYKVRARFESQSFISFG